MLIDNFSFLKQNFSTFAANLTNYYNVMTTAVKANECQAQIDEFMSKVKNRIVNQPEFVQAVQEVAESVIPVIEKTPAYKKAKVLERLTDPDKVFMFRVSTTRYL